MWECHTEPDDSALERGRLAGSLHASPFPPNQDPRSFAIAFLLLPGFSLLSLSSFLAPFEKANALLGEARFAWSFAGEEGRPVVCSSGFEMPATLSFARVKPGHPRSEKLDMVVLVSGSCVERRASQDLSSAIRMCKRQKIPVVALGTSAWLLAEMGALRDVTCTIHWEKMAAFSETFCGPRITDAIYAEDDGIWSCAGESAAFDLAVNLIEEKVGPRLAQEVCKLSIIDRPRDASCRQAGAASAIFGGISEKLHQAIALMAQNVQEPIDLARIARQLDLSRRQLERLFGAYVGASPHKYYMRLRLDRAKQLIEGTSMSLIEIAIACGFVSTAHFSKCFRHHHGRTPTEVRRSRRSMSSSSLDRYRETI